MKQGASRSTENYILCFFYEVVLCYRPNKICICLTIAMKLWYLRAQDFKPDAKSQIQILPSTSCVTY